jgi:hypothetical protein
MLSVEHPVGELATAHPSEVDNDTSLPVLPAPKIDLSLSMDSILESTSKYVLLNIICEHSN